MKTFDLFVVRSSRKRDFNSIKKRNRTHGLARFNSHHIPDAVNCPTALGRLGYRPGQFLPLDGACVSATTLGADGVAACAVGSVRLCIGALDTGGESVSYNLPARIERISSSLFAAKFVFLSICNASWINSLTNRSGNAVNTPAANINAAEGKSSFLIHKYIATTTPARMEMAASTTYKEMSILNTPNDGETSGLTDEVIPGEEEIASANEPRSSSSSPVFGSGSSSRSTFLLLTTTGSSIMKVSPHFWHFPFFPTYSSDALNFALQCGHVAVKSISDSPADGVDDKEISMSEVHLNFKRGQATIPLTCSSRTPEGAPYANRLAPAKHGIGLTLPPRNQPGLEFDMLLLHAIGPSCPSSFAVLLGFVQSYYPARLLRLGRPPP